MLPLDPHLHKLLSVLREKDFCRCPRLQLINQNRTGSQRRRSRVFLQAPMASAALRLPANSMNRQSIAGYRTAKSGQMRHARLDRRDELSGRRRHRKILVDPALPRQDAHSSAEV
jgi:hypothetical protein